MERRSRSPVLTRQKSNNSSVSSTAGGGGGGGVYSPTAMSPMNRHARSGSAGVSNFRRAQNNAARAAAQRLARVMAQSNDDGSDDEDRDNEPMPPIELSTPRRANRSQSPAIGRYLAEQTSTIRATSAGRPSMVAKQPAMIPPIKPSPKPMVTSVRTESPVVSRREKRVSVDLGNLNMRETSSSRSSSVNQDEIDVQQVENETISEKHRLAEERCEEVEARTRLPEKQIASHGEGVSLHVRTSRREATLPRREAAPKASVPNSIAKREEHVPLRWESKISRDEVASPVDLQVAESEIKTLRTLIQKMMLNQEQMEEVVLKRCWLSRNWKLCVHHGIYADIAERKQEYWSSLAPLPTEVVLSAGEKARDENSSEKADEDDQKLLFDLSDLAGEGNIENMLLVEKGLRELASLKVEEAILLARGQDRHANIKAGQSSSGAILSAEGSNPVEAFDLSDEESEDVLFKRAWLTYFWRRVKNHGLEEDIADDRLQFWIDQSAHSPSSQDAVEVERGLLELKKLGIETQLWEATRRGTDSDFSNRGSQSDSEK